VAEFDVNGVKYRSGKMNAFQQFHVTRKLGPILAKLGPSLVDKTKPDSSMLEMLEPVLDALAEMPETDCDYVLHRCLAVVQRAADRDANIWTPVWNEPAKKLMFNDIDMAAMIQISIQVLGDNLGNFINAPASTTLQQNLPGSVSQGNS
jgi:hypothetical protein